MATSDHSRPPERWVLRLYVAGQTERCRLALANLQRICETHLPGRYAIEVVDLREHPSLAAGDQIVAIPTLVRKLPQPLKNIVGNLADEHRVLVGLNLIPVEASTSDPPTPQTADVSPPQAEPSDLAAPPLLPHYLLRLYIAGVSPRSSLAVENLRKLCEEHLLGHCTLEVIDIYQQPLLAEGDQIIAVPTLIRKLPEPLRRFVGDMSDTPSILVGLDLRTSRSLL